MRRGEAIPGKCRVPALKWWWGPKYHWYEQFQVHLSWELTADESILCLLTPTDLIFRPELIPVLSCGKFPKDSSHEDLVCTSKQELSLFCWPFTIKYSDFSPLPPSQNWKYHPVQSRQRFLQVFLAGKLFWPALLKALFRPAGVSQMILAPPAKLAFPLSSKLFASRLKGITVTPSGKSTGITSVLCCHVWHLHRMFSSAHLRAVGGQLAGASQDTIKWKSK